MARFESLKSLTVGSVLVGALTFSGAGVAFAQEEAEPTVSHPAHIHEGTCDDLNPTPLAPLNNLIPRTPEEEEEVEVQGVLTVPEVTYSQTDVELNLEEDILASSHSINVHESDANIDNYIACGEIGGVVVDDTLVIALSPLNDSGQAGIAILTAEDDNTSVDVFLAPVVDGTQPAATPVS